MSNSKLNQIIVFTILILTLSAIKFDSLADSIDIVNPHQIYTYDIMTEDIKKLKEAHPNIIEYKSIGKTKFGRDIWAVKLGKGKSNIMINGSHHAREWLTTNLIMYMLDKYSQDYAKEEILDSYNVKEILNNTSIWFVPMVNPDGVTLQQSGISSFPQQYQSDLLKLNNYNTDFKIWKANAEGIDLNRQYPANWDSITESSPGPFGYKGTKPLSTSETKAMYDFTYEIDPEITVSYHSSGNILYWHFLNKPENEERDYKIAKIFSEITGYELVEPIKKLSPNLGGGYKDWFIQEFGRPGFTPEIGDYVDETNLPLSSFDKEWNKNRTIGLLIAKQGFDLWLKRNSVDVFTDSVLNNTQSLILDDTAFVPLDYFLENNYYVKFDENNNKILLAKDKIRASLSVNTDEIKTDNGKQHTGSSPTYINNRIMVPLKVVKYFNANVEWNNTSRNISIQYEPQSNLAAKKSMQ